MMGARPKRESEVSWTTHSPVLEAGSEGSPVDGFRAGRLSYQVVRLYGTRPAGHPLVE